MTGPSPAGQHGSERHVGRLLVNLSDMTTDRLLDLVGAPGGPLADATLFDLQVTEALAITPTFRRVVLTAPGLEGLRFQAGQDLMLRIPQAGDRVVNRRYTIRDFDPTRAAVTIDVSLHGAGPGTDWIRAARIGDRIDGIGPRGKVTLQEDVDWHLFVADETGVPGGLAMIEALTPGSAATAVFEVDAAADEQQFRSPDGETVEVRWLHRDGRSQPGDPSLIVDGAGRRGHARRHEACLRGGRGRSRPPRACRVARTGPRPGPDLGEGVLAPRPAQRGTRGAGS